MKKHLLFIAALLPQALPAQTGTPGEPPRSAKVRAFDTGSREMLPIEVRAVRLSEWTPFPKSNLTARDLAPLNQGQDLPFLLQYTPSSVATSDAGNGVGYTGLRIRGTDGSRINVTLNGVPVNDAESQGAFFVDLPDVASSTNSVQIQRGAGTSTNGAGSFGASISLNTLQQSDRAGADAILSAGSFNTRRLTVRAGTGVLPGGFQLDVRLSRVASDGFIDRAASDLRSAQLIAGWKVSPRTRFRFLVMTGTEKTYQAWNGIPEEKLRGDYNTLSNHYQNNKGSLYFTPGDSVNLFSADPRRYNAFQYRNQTDNYQQDYYQFFGDHEFSDRLALHAGAFLTRGKGFYEEYKPGESFSGYGRPDFVPAAGDTFTSTDLIRQLWLDNKYYGGVFSLHYRQGQTELTLGGIGARYEGYHYGYVKWADYGFPDDYRWYRLRADKNELSGYLKGQHLFGDRLLAYADLQLRLVRYDIYGFRKNPLLSPQAAYNFFNPRAGVSYFLGDAQSKRQKLYLSAGVVNKEPNREDFEASVNGTPKAERLYDAEGGYEISRRTWNASVNLFYMYYQDQLVLTGQINDVGAYTRVNIPESYRRGIEEQASWQALRWLRISENLTLSQNRIVRFTEYVDDYDNGGQEAIVHDNAALAFSPSATGALVLGFEPFRLRHGQRLYLDVYNKYVSRQYLDNTQRDDRRLGAYGLTDLRLNYAVQGGPFRELVLTGAVLNVLDKQYESNGYTYSYIYGGQTTTQNFYFPQAGRNFLVSAAMKF